MDDITIQHILKHSDINVTRKAYIQTLPQQTVDGMVRVQAAWQQRVTSAVQ